MIFSFFSSRRQRKLEHESAKEWQSFIASRLYASDLSKAEMLFRQTTQELVTAIETDRLEIAEAKFWVIEQVIPQMVQAAKNRRSQLLAEQAERFLPTLNTIVDQLPAAA